MQYSPKLKKAAEEIKLTLKKYDIAAHVVLHTPGHSEYLMELTPSYSCVRIEEKGFRFRAKKSDYDGNVALRDKKITDSVNMIESLCETGGKNILSLMGLSDELHKIYDIESTDGGHSSHEQQNN